ncbi:DUF455 family protein, partial [Mycetohabitans sp. B6]|uniref:DUF455 family protein n=1 Tax=Mycetohabitans sp. B6 TaxID=2841843 RepID=UPI00351D1EDF
PAHDGLWEMAERTRADVLARIALVPRTLEARGLDASPPAHRPARGGLHRCPAPPRGWYARPTSPKFRRRSH